MRKKTDYDANIDRRTGKIEATCARYDMGRATMTKIAEAAGAVIRVGRSVTYNWTKIDEYLDSISSK